MTTPPRVQLALNVSDIDAAVDFYGRMFGAEPHKRRPGYANFALESPALKLVLIENASAAGSLNHLGIEVPDIGAVASARDRLASAQLDTRDEDDVVCCFARQDKVWVDDPDGAAWEVYTITDDDPALELTDQGSACCGQSGADAAEPCCAS
jgi:catechol 2,3-dioxygenase-like lactoylglutathione lyase family enzyme